MMEKSAQADEGERYAHPLSLHLPPRTKFKVVVYAPAEREDTLPLSLLYP